MPTTPINSAIVCENPRTPSLPILRSSSYVLSMLCFAVTLMEAGLVSVTATVHEDAFITFS